MRNADWLDIAEALRIMLERVETTGTEAVPLHDAAGRTLAQRAVSPVDQPPWDNSAMDGFAVRSADVETASADRPVTLDVIDDIPAGSRPQRPVGAGQASRIMTGAPLPAGADGVIRLEHTMPESGARVVVLRSDDAGRNVRFRGEDIRAGTTVLDAGRLLGSAEIGLLAMIGCAAPVVQRRPVVAILSSGDELVDASSKADIEAGTHIADSNSPAVAAGVRATGGTPLTLGIARDDMGDIRSHLARTGDADALITTAGASVGDHDLVKAALEEAGWETLFWRVRIRPGSPFSFGVLRRGERTIPVFGLPGNPVSALVTFEILVRPVLRRMAGRAHIHPVVERAVAGEQIRSPSGLVRFLRVRLEDGEDGMRRAYLTGPQGSGILTSVTRADALLVVPREESVLEAGGIVRIVPLRTGNDAQEQLDLP